MTFITVSLLAVSNKNKSILAKVNILACTPSFLLAIRLWCCQYFMKSIFRMWYHQDKALIWCLLNTNVNWITSMMYFVRRWCLILYLLVLNLTGGCKWLILYLTGECLNLTDGCKWQFVFLLVIQNFTASCMWQTQLEPLDYTLICHPRLFNAHIMWATC